MTAHRVANVLFERLEVVGLVAGVVCRAAQLDTRREGVSNGSSNESHATFVVMVAAAFHYSHKQSPKLFVHSAMTFSSYRAATVVAVILTITSLPSTYAASATYEVDYDGGRVMHVRADLPAGDGRLLVAQGGGIDHLPDQWATFVHGLHVTLRNGTSVEATSIGKEGWRLGRGDAVEVTYDVDLAYAVGQWPAGNEQSGRLFPHALYTVTKPLFVKTSGITDAEVRFHLPERWRAATPWDALPGNRFGVRTAERLSDNSIVLGIFPSAKVSVGAFEITVAVPGVTAMPPRLTKALKEIGTTATSLFDQTPRGTYLMTFFREDSEDGESYENSAAITSPDPFDQAGMIVTGNTLVHELLHHWIGGQIAPVEHDSMAWFTEGFTEYYANIATARSGAVRPDLLLRKFNNQVAGYLYFFESPLFSGVTLADAGRKKGSYRFGVYNGGWALALFLDVHLRTETGGRRSLDDVMRLLYARNGVTGKSLTTADVRSAVSEVAGRDLGSVFDTYVEKRNELPIAETLAKIGITLRGQPYAADIFLVEDPAAPPNAVALRRAMFRF